MKTKAASSFIVYTCSYIKFSDIFKGCENASVAFTDSSPDCSWGDNDRTMVTASFIQQSLEMMKGYSDNQADKEIEIVMERLDNVPSNIYIDLES